MSNRVFSRGDVVWAPDFFKLSMRSELGEPNPRPWLVINTDAHPFSDEEYIALSLTTTKRDIAVKIDDLDWVTGGGPRNSYVVPWNPATLKHGWVGDNRQGRLSEKFVEEAVEEMKGYV
ncbi:MAG: hypothetical protein U5J64_09435 [Halobacteriales archaeon]|nr:hypothetical protein [Halobacteriales archaeon]